MSDVYEIRTVKDFLMVPDEKRPEMLADFMIWMEMCAKLEESFPQSELSVNDYFKWKDDGITGCSEINLFYRDKVTP